MGASRRRFGDRVADAISYWGGTWRFIIGLLAGMALWAAWNLAATKPLDPYPFILLNLALSTLAAIQAPIILMSQRRADARRDRRAESEYKLIVLAESQLKKMLEHEQSNATSGYL